jgi:hypothetical protein
MIYLDVYIESVQCGAKVRLRPTAGVDSPLQRCKTDSGIIVPVPRYWIAGSRAIRNKYPVRTIFIADLQLISPERSGNYLKIRTGYELDFPHDENSNVAISPNGQLRIF